MRHETSDIAEPAGRKRAEARAVLARTNPNFMNENSESANL
jgi:hypothetical protein